jgi:hypothetical protein
MGYAVWKLYISLSPVVVIEKVDHKILHGRTPETRRKNVLRGTSKSRIASAAVFAPDLNAAITCCSLSSFSRDSGLVCRVMVGGVYGFRICGIYD